jgi:vancomycin resistance protein YoaR
MRATTQKRYRYFYYGLIATFGGINLLFWTTLALSQVSAHRLPYGTTIPGQSLAGLTAKEAVDKLTPIHEALLKQKMTLTIDSHVEETTLADLGYTVNTEAMVNQALTKSLSLSPFARLFSTLRFNSQTVPFQLTLSDPDRLKSYFTTLDNSLPDHAKDLSLDFKDGQIITNPAENGVTLDPQAMQTALETGISSQPYQENWSIVLPATISSPSITSDDQVAAAKGFLEQLIAHSLIVQVDDTKIEIKPDTVYSFVIYTTENNQLSVAFDETKIRSQVDQIAKKLAIAPQVKKVSTVDNSTIVEGRDGRKIDAADATKQMLDKLKANSLDTPLILSAQKIDRKVQNEGAEYDLGRDPGKYIDIDLSLQRLNLIEGTTHVAGFSASTGKWSTPTPIGQFTIKNHFDVAWSKRFKLYMPHWMGIMSASGDYDGYGIHGLPYWPSGYVEGTNHIGTPVSHGCIRLGPGSIEQVYSWAPDGTKVFIHE